MIISGRSRKFHCDLKFDPAEHFLDFGGERKKKPADPVQSKRGFEKGLSKR